MASANSSFFLSLDNSSGGSDKGMRIMRSKEGGVEMDEMEKVHENLSSNWWHSCRSTTTVAQCCDVRILVTKRTKPKNDLDRAEKSNS